VVLRTKTRVLLASLSDGINSHSVVATHFGLCYRSKTNSATWPNLARRGGLAG